MEITTELYLKHLEQVRKNLVLAAEKITDLINATLKQSLDTIDLEIDKVHQWRTRIDSIAAEDLLFLNTCSFPQHAQYFTNIQPVHQQVVSFFKGDFYSEIVTKNNEDCESLIFCDTECNTVKIDLENFSSETLPYLNNRCVCAGQVCRVSSETYFLNGGINEDREIFNKSCIIDLKHHTITELPPSQVKKSFGGCVSCHKKIYSFGGFSYKPLADSECFDHESLTWTTIASLPQESFWNYSSVINGQIHVLGFLMKDLVRYEPNSNTYSKVIELGIEKRKLLLEKWVITNGTLEIYEITPNGIEKHCLESPWNGHYLVNSETFRRGKWVYFLEGHSNETKGTFLRRFDTCRKVIEELAFT